MFCSMSTSIIEWDFRFSGVNPAFDESFQFQISVPELALVRFLVLDDDFIDDDFIGQYTVPFECLQSGTFRFFLERISPAMMRLI